MELTSEAQVIDDLFRRGKELFNQRDFYNAHEVWEDLWSDYYVPDHKFIQGLIQMSVSFFHIQNDNLKGAKSLMNKCLEKFSGFHGVQRGIDIAQLTKELLAVQKDYNQIEDPRQFNWDLVPLL